MAKITIGQTSDLHGFLYPSNYFEDKCIGILSLADSLKKCDLIIDTGDLIQGSALTTYQNQNKLDKPNAIIQTLNEIGYNIHTFGNHEFNYGIDYLTNSFKNFKGDILVANIKSNLNLNIKPYKIYHIKGLRIAVIGLITKVVPYFEQPKNISGIQFYDPVLCYKEYEQELLDNSDIVIVNYHGGFEYDYTNPNPTSKETTGENQGIELLNNFDSISILLSGHQHQKLCNKYKNTHILQPGYAGEYYSYITIDTSTYEITANLVENKGKASKDIENFSELEKNVQSFLNIPIYELYYDILINDHFKARSSSCPFVNLIHEIQIDASCAEISTTSLFDTAIGFTKSITMRQIIANYPFDNTLKVLKLHKSDIIEALEVCASYFDIKDNVLTVSEKFTVPKKQHYQYDMFYGFNYEFDITKPVGQRVVYTNLEDRYYNVVMSNYRSSNYGWYPMYEEKEVICEIQTNIQDLIVNFLNSKKVSKDRLNKKNFNVKF